MNAIESSWRRDLRTAANPAARSLPPRKAVNPRDACAWLARSIFALFLLPFFSTSLCCLIFAVVYEELSRILTGDRNHGSRKACSHASFCAHWYVLSMQYLANDLETDDEQGKSISIPGTLIYFRRSEHNGQHCLDFKLGITDQKSRGKGTPRRKVKKVHKSSGTDDKKLQGALKKMNVQAIPAIEEVNMFKSDGNVIHFSAPKGKHAYLTADGRELTDESPSTRLRTIQHIRYLRQRRRQRADGARAGHSKSARPRLVGLASQARRELPELTKGCRRRGQERR